MFNAETTTAEAKVNFDNLSTIIADIAAFFQSFYAQIMEFIEALASKFAFENNYTREVEETGDGK